MMITDEELAGMIKKTERCADVKINIPVAPNAFAMIVDALMELKERRETELRPANKFLYLSFEDQLAHVKSEIVEIEQAHEQYKKTGITQDLYARLDEITDAQHSLQTLKKIAGTSYHDNMKSHRRIIAKDKSRGYYDEISNNLHPQHEEVGKLKQAAMPIVEYLRTHCDPHQAVVVTWDQIKIMTDEMGIPIKD